MGRSSKMSGAFLGTNLGGVSYGWQNALHCILIHFIFIQSSVGQVPFSCQLMGRPIEQLTDGEMFLPFNEPKCHRVPDES